MGAKRRLGERFEATALFPPPNSADSHIVPFGADSHAASTHAIRMLRIAHSRSPGGEPHPAAWLSLFAAAAIRSSVAVRAMRTWSLAASPADSPGPAMMPSSESRARESQQFCPVVDHR